MRWSDRSVLPLGDECKWELNAYQIECWSNRFSVENPRSSSPSIFTFKDRFGQQSFRTRRTGSHFFRPPVRLSFSSRVCQSKTIRSKIARLDVMKPWCILVIECMVLVVAVIACGNSTNVNSVATPTPTPCVMSQTTISGQSAFATPMSSQPTFSPEMQATAEARLRQANPGTSATPGPAQPVAPLPPCPTNTPTATVQPPASGGGLVQGTLAPNQPILSPEQRATAEARMQLANPGAPTTAH